jgi:transposase/transcriptional regulator NrdR family protein
MHTVWKARVWRLAKKRARLGGTQMTEASECPRCGSTHISKAGYRFSNEGKTARQRYRCLDCQKWFLAEYIENPQVPKKKVHLRDFKYQDQPIPQQDWIAYTKAQNNEKRVLQNILKELLDNVEIKVTDGKLGRHYLDMKDMCFSLALKTYTKLSSRRLNSDLEKAKHEEYITKVPHFTTLMNWLEKEEMTQLLLELIKLSALPVKAIETQYAIDSSGFSSSQFGRWFNYKYNEEKVCRNWVKAHVMIGTKTNIITSVELTKAHGADVIKLEPLVEATCKNFNVKEVSADMAYSSRKNLQIIVDHGAIPYIPFKKNTRSRSFGVSIWRNMHHYFQNHPQEFFEHYHKRSNVETTFSMIKQKFGKDVLSRNFKSQTNEVLLKILCHNICCLIHEYYENNIENYYSTEKSQNQLTIVIG